MVWLMQTRGTMRSEELSTQRGGGLTQAEIDAMFGFVSTAAEQLQAVSDLPVSKNEIDDLNRAIAALKASPS